MIIVRVHPRSLDILAANVTLSSRRFDLGRDGSGVYKTVFTVPRFLVYVGEGRCQPRCLHNGSGGGSMSINHMWENRIFPLPRAEKYAGEVGSFTTGSLAVRC